MSAMFQKLVDSGFMTSEQATYVNEAVMNKESIIVSGHKGWGILPLLATISTVAKNNFDILQVKGYESLEEKSEYFIISKPKDVDYEKLITDAISIIDIPMIAIKDPDHPFSLFKLLKSVYKVNGDTSKVYQVIECAKEDDVKKIGKITKVTMNESGKLIKENL